MLARSRQNRHVATVAAGLFVVAYGTNVSTPFLVLYKDRLNLGASATMAIFAVYVVGILGTLLVVGPLSDRFGRKPLVVPFVALSGVASLIMVAGRNELALLLLGRFLLGVVSGVVIAIGAAWLQELLGSGAAQRAAVITTVVTMAGFGFGPLVSAVFERLLPAPLVVPFLVHAVVTAAVLPGLLRVPDTVEPALNPSPFRIDLGVPPEARRTFVVVVVPAAVWVFGFPSTSFALFPVLLSETIDGFDVTVAALSGTLTAWAGLGVRPLIDRIGPIASLPLGLWLGVTGYVFGLIAFETDAWPLLLPGALCLGLAAGAITAGCLTILGGLAEDDRRGALTSTFYLLAYPGMAMPLVITGLASQTSTSVALGIVTSAAAIAALLVTASQRREATMVRSVVPSPER